MRTSRSASTRRVPARPASAGPARRLSVMVGVLLVWLALAPIAGADLTTVEGQSFSGTAVVIGGCGLSSAAIDWGDGTSSPGADDGNLGIAGTHTYAAAGSYAGTATYTCTQFGGVHQASFTATVADAPLTSAGTPISGTVGAPVNGTTAHFDDGNPGAVPTDFSAQIAWGDGAVSAGTVAVAAGGGFDVSGAHTYSAAGNFSLTTSITDIGGSKTSADSTAAITAGAPPPAPLPPPAPGPLPVNVTRPTVTYSLYRGGFVCNPGTWQNLPASPTFGYEWLLKGRDTSGPGGVTLGTTKVVATTSMYAPGNTNPLDQYACRVTARNLTGPAVATSSFRRLAPLTVTNTPYGNFRIRGIDVYQVVQPNSCAGTFAYPGSGGFPCFAGGGTPTSYGPSGKLGLGEDPQSTLYLGSKIDADRRTAAIVYVDSTEPVASASQPLDVTLSAQYGGRQIGNLTLTRRITNPPLSSTAWVTATERATPAYGVRFDIPALWLQVPATLGGTLDLVAKVGFPTGSSPLISECSPGRACSADNTFHLTGIVPQHLPPLEIRTVELLGGGQGLSSLSPPDQVLAGARQLFPGGDQLSVRPYSNWIGVVNQETLTATPVPPQSGEIPPVFACSNQRYASTATTVQTSARATRFCRIGAITALVTQWEIQNPGSGYDVTMAVHDYALPPGSGREPGWTDTGGSGSLATVTPSPGTYVHPLFLVNDGSANRPLTAAAHEFGHVMGLPHAELFPYANPATPDCGGSTGGQTGEAWPPDNQGRLQGTKFNSEASTSALARTNQPLVDGQGTTTLFDLMSYCAPERTAWLSARNWNHAFGTLLGYGARLDALAARSAHVARSAALAPPGEAFAVGVATGSGASIVRVVPSRAGDAVPAAVPASPLQLRALDASGHVLEQEGIQVAHLVDAPGVSVFAGPVPARAATVQVLSQGVVLDQRRRNRAPLVRLLAPVRRAHVRAHGSLLVRWSASDPDGDPLQATVDYSSDAGRSWRSIYDGPSTSRVSVPGRLLEGSPAARIRVYVNDGFNEATATSRLFVADGTPPVAQIIRPGQGEPVTAGQPTLLLGSAFDDRQQALSGRALTWFAGRLRLGTGARLRATLPPGRVSLRLRARDRLGRDVVTTRTVRVAGQPLRLRTLTYHDTVRRRSPTVTVRISTSAKASLHIGGVHYGVGPRARTIVIGLPRRNLPGLVILHFTLRSAADGSEPGEITVVRQ